MNPQDIEFLVRFICESDAIEGIADDPGLVQTQLESRHARGHAGAMLLLSEYATQKIPLIHMFVKQTQSLIVAEQHEKGEKEIAQKYRGEWRDCDVWVGGRKGVSPTHISTRMRTLIRKTMSWQWACAELLAAQKVAFIARFHYEYERIHPFIDGNGRSGRALVYYLYRYAELPPFVFTADDRHETYYQCFRDPAQMIEYFLDRTALNA